MVMAAHLRRVVNLDENVRTFLFACASHDLKTVKECIVQKRIPIDTFDGNGNTGLMLAARNRGVGQLAMIEYLLDQGADAFRVNSFGRTAKQQAEMFECKEAYERLAEHEKLAKEYGVSTAGDKPAPTEGMLEDAMDRLVSDVRALSENFTRRNVVEPRPQPQEAQQASPPPAPPVQEPAKKQEPPALQAVQARRLKLGESTYAFMRELPMLPLIITEFIAKHVYADLRTQLELVHVEVDEETITCTALAMSRLHLSNPAFVSAGVSKASERGDSASVEWYKKNCSYVFHAALLPLFSDSKEVKPQWVEEAAKMRRDAEQRIKATATSTALKLLGLELRDYSGKGRSEPHMPLETTYFA